MVPCVTQPSASSEELRLTHSRKFKYNEAAPSGVVGVSGKPIGHRRKDGYWILSYGGKHMLAHRVVWMLNFGVIPDGMVIDHINRDPSDNRIVNLRCVPQSVNLTNVPVRSHSKTGHKYIAQDKRTGNWTVRIARVSYGTFPTLEEALEVRDSLIKTH